MPTFTISARKIILGLAGLAVVGGLAAAGVIYSGVVTVSARPPHTALTTLVLHDTFKASIARKAKQVTAPDNLGNAGMIALGGQHYEQVCSSCHGGPGLGQSPQALSMRPRPQALTEVVDQFTDEELFVILRDGVRFSAMPSWPADSNFDEIWSVVAFLRRIPDMTAEQYAKATKVDLNAPEVLDAVFAWNERGAAMPLTMHAMAPPMEEYNYSSPSTGWRPIGLGDAPLAYCAACHGLDGTGAVTGGQAPNLAILSEERIATRLREYASGKRASGIMAVVASSLSEPQIDALALYFSALPDEPPQQDDANAAPVTDTSLGQRIVQAGLFDKGVAACANCHSDQGLAETLGVPRIAGQTQAFLERRLHEYATSEDVGGTTWNPMHVLAARMSTDDRTSVATYLAGLPADTPLMLAPAQPPLETAAAEYVTCATCHMNNATDFGLAAPNLTLQSAPYLAYQLSLFRSDKRAYAAMEKQTHGLAPEQLESLASYIGRMPASDSIERGDWRVSAEEDIAAAATLATQGDPARGIAACSSCHVETMGALPLIPQLNGQEPFYLYNRLQYFSGTGANEVMSPMPHIAGALTLSEHRGLADYFAAQDILPK